jgi:hypothetical protein
MGKGTDVGTAVKRQVVTAAEEQARRLEARTLRAPQANHQGQIVDRPEPQAAPQPVIQATEDRWD